MNKVMIAVGFSVALTGLGLAAVDPHHPPPQGHRAPPPDAGTIYASTSTIRPIGTAHVFKSLEPHWNKAPLAVYKDSGREVLYFKADPEKVAHHDGGTPWWAWGDVADFDHVYLPQPDGGTAFVERTDAGWVAHGMLVAE